MTPRITPAALVTALALAGCADPYDEPAREAQPTLPPGEEPAPPLPQRADDVAAQHLAATPAEAARRAAELTSNWTAETVARRYAELARMTVGPARRDARESAARLPTDNRLGASETRSTGTVEAVTTRAASARRHQLIVVTHETLVGDGLRDERWRVTLATVERRSGGWVLSRWEPQP
jgi:hypothetical protein